MPTLDARTRATMKYQDKAIRRVVLSFNRNTMPDIIEKINSVPNKQGYIVSLIRADIARNGAPQPATYKYYTLLRPAAPGAIPGGAVSIVNLDDIPFIDEINHQAFSIVEYAHPLSDAELADYEMTACNE